MLRGLAVGTASWEGTEAGVHRQLLAGREPRSYCIAVAQAVVAAGVRAGDADCGAGPGSEAGSAPGLEARLGSFWRVRLGLRACRETAHHLLGPRRALDRSLRPAALG